MDKIAKQYEQSIEELKKINDKLFYDDLKGKMNTHLKTMQEEYEKVEEIVDIIKKESEKMSFSVQDDVKQATMVMQSTSNKIDSTINEAINQKTEEMINELGDIYNMFHGIAEEQKQFVQKDFIEVAKAQFDLNVKELEALHSKMNKLIEHQKAYIEEKEKERNEQTKKLETDLKNQIQNIENQLNEKLITIENLHKQLEHSMKENTIETNKTLQNSFDEIINQVRDVEHTLKEKEQTYQLAIVEQKESFQLSLSEQQKIQQDKLMELEKMQGEQGATMHKWLIGLSISQIVSIGAIIGLYFF